jgi:hypothetical protein
MNILSDDCIQKLVDFIEDKTQNSLFQSMTQSESEKPVHKSYKFEDTEYTSGIGQKLSNIEKHIIKRIRNKD